MGDLFTSKYENPADYSYNDGFDFRALADYFLKEFPLAQGASLLDVGFGRGDLLKGFIARRPDLMVYGVERSASMSEFARKEMPALRQLPFLRGAIEFASASFDCVVARFSLVHLLDDRRLLIHQLREIRRVLKPGGIFWFTEITQTTSRVQYQPLLNYSEDGQAHVLPLMNGPEWFETMCESGFQVYKYRCPNEFLNMGGVDHPYHFVDMILCP